MKIRTIDLTPTTKLFGTAFLCVVLAMSMLWPSPLRAQTYSVSELQVLLNQIMAQLNALQNNTGVSGVCPYYWQRDLGMGSTGADVMRLQQFLNGSPDTRLALGGAGSPGMETQYYGPITANAVTRFQAKYRAEVLTPIGLVNGTGYFGPMSRAKANDLCITPTPQPPGGEDDNDGELRGGAGFIDEIELISNIGNEEVGEGDEDIDVLGLEVTPGGSDIELMAVAIELDPIGHDEDFTDYASELSIYVNGREYARVDADEFEDDDFRANITLDRGAIIREDDMGELVIAVSAVSNLDSDQEGDQWAVVVDSIRFRDAIGASISNNDADDLSRTFTFTEFAEASGLEVNVRGGDEDVNDSRIIEVSSNDDTDDEPVLSFEVEVEGDSDVTVEDLRVSVETTGGDLDDIVSAAYLYRGNDRVDSVNINSDSDAIVFSDIDLELDAEDVHEFEVRFDFREANGTNYSSGATVDVDVTSADLDAWEMEDERGDDVDDSDRRGSASADAHILQTEGVALTLVNSTTREVYNSSVPSSSYGEFRMTVDVRAIGSTVYVPTTSVRDDEAENVGLTYLFEDSVGGVYSGGTSVSSFSRVSGGSVQGSYVRINEGQTARFELVATLNPEEFGQYRAQILSAGWNDTAAVPDNVTLALPEANYDTGYQVISN